MLAIRNTKTHRYAFNGKEKDDEVKGSGNSYDYGFRIFDPRIGRFLSIDPIAKQYAELTTYQYASNSPIKNVDIDGAESLPEELINRAIQYGETKLRQATQAVIIGATKALFMWGEQKVEEKKQELLKEPSSAAAVLFTEWATGSGPSQREFGPSSKLSQALKDAPKVEEARYFLYRKNLQNFKEGKPLQGVTDYGAGFGIVGLINAGGDAVEQFIGSYDINIKIDQKNKLVIYTISNTTSLESFLYGAAPEYNRSEFGPGGNITQTYIFTEPLVEEYFDKVQTSEKHKNDLFPPNDAVKNKLPTPEVNE